MTRFIGWIGLATLFSGCVTPPPGGGDPSPVKPIGPPEYGVAVDVPAAPFEPDHAAPALPRWAIIGRPMVTRLIAGAELVECSVGDGAKEVELQVVLFDSGRCDLRVIDQTNGWAGSGVIRDVMRSVHAVAGVNGGFFTPGFHPMGLVVADGVSSGGFQNSGLVSGGVATGVRGPMLVWNSEFQAADAFSQFLQAGPRLVSQGEPVAGLSPSKKATRTFVATDGESRWAVGLAKSPSLKELAEVLASPGLLPELRVTRALNLDGGRSSSLWVRREDGEELAWTGWSTVRNYLAIVPR